MTRRITEYAVTSDKIVESLTLALVSDLHNGPFEDVLPALGRADAILIVGDLVDRYRDGYHNAIRFLEQAPDIAPTFYAIGNHERSLQGLDDYWPHVLSSRVTLLDNRFTPFRNILLGGLSSERDAPVRTDFLQAADASPAFKLLMCHQPDYFLRYVAPHDIDLTVSGHAHGGQVQLFGRGMYAPDQGLFPRWTHGFYFDRRLLVSRGMTNSTRLPRFNNPCELILLKLTRQVDE